MKNKLILGVVFGLAIFCFSFLYIKARNDYPKGHFKRTSQKLFPKGNEINTTLNLSTKEDHVLVIRYKPNKYSSKTIFLNSTELLPNVFPYTKIENGVERNYIHIPSHLINSGANILKIVFLDGFPQEISLRLTNYRKDIFNSIYILPSESGYRVVATSDFFLHIALMLVIFLVLYIASLIKTQATVLKFLLEQSSLSRKKAVLFFSIFIALNLGLYWQSFFHLFRHDEWFLFLSSNNDSPSLRFFIKHIDWQLFLPYDRLVFRPLQHGMLAFNRVVFDTSYIGPHILSFGKHLMACFCLWWLMWEYNRRWISALFVLLFSVLITKIDPVIFPHVDAYTVTTILTILAIIAFQKTVNNTISPYKGFLLASFFLLFNLLTTEIVFLMPFFFFILYRFFFRNTTQTNIKAKDRASWLMLLLPLILWGILFAIHIWRAYPDFAMTAQSDSIGLLSPLFNTARFVFVTAAGAVYPFTDTCYSDKTYFKVSVAGAIWTIVMVGVCIRFRKKVFMPISKEFLVAMVLIIAVSLIVCFGRASYVDSLLDNLMLPTSYTYLVAAMGIYAFYTALDFEKIKKNKVVNRILSVLLVLLILSHSLKTYQSNKEIENATYPLKNYFNSVKSFVEEHKKEPDFSFKIIDRPPTIKIFPWYHQSCIDGLFNKYTSQENPKYLLEYDYGARILNYSLYNDKPVIIDSNETTLLLQPDYVNSLGMGFRPMFITDKNLLIGTTEVTQKQWKDLMSYNPSRFVNDSHPVENVSLKMVQEFINKLNQIEGANVYRLPTEPEYTQLISPSSAIFNDIQSDPNKSAWLKANSNATTHRVGLSNPLSKGLFDIIGNVWEWTSTVIHAGSPATAYEDNPRICFGGSWRDENVNIDTLTTNYPPDFRHEHLGFRLVVKIPKNK